MIAEIQNKAHLLSECSSKIDISKFEDKMRQNPVFKKQFTHLLKKFQNSPHKARYIEQIKKLLAHEELIFNEHRAVCSFDLQRFTTSDSMPT